MSNEAHEDTTTIDYYGSTGTIIAQNNAERLNGLVSFMWHWNVPASKADWDKGVNEYDFSGYAFYSDKTSFDINKALESATTTRLELRQRQISREQQEMSMVQVKDNDSFNGNISLSLGIMGDSEDFNHVYDNPTNNPRIAISFSVPIFDWGARKARIKAAEIERKMFELSAEEELKSIEMNVRSTCRSLDNLLGQISIAEQSQKNAQLTYDLNEERYRNGELTGMQMNQFQTQLSNSKMSYTQAIINYKVQLLNLKILTLYDFEKDEPVAPMTYEQSNDNKKK
jgi:hypothetical protein